MRTSRTATALAIALAVGLAFAGCGTPTAEETATPTRSSTSPTATPSASGTPSATPTQTPTDAPAEWTPAQLTDACIEFQAGWAESEGYSADDFEWQQLASTQQNGSTWYVFLQGTFTTPGGETVPAEYSCAVTGTPDAPVVKETPSE